MTEPERYDQSPEDLAKELEARPADQSKDQGSFLEGYSLVMLTAVLDACTAGRPGQSGGQGPSSGKKQSSEHLSNQPPPPTPRGTFLLISSDRADGLADILQRLRRGEPIEAFETDRLQKDASPVAVAVRVSPIRDAAGLGHRPRPRRAAACRGQWRERNWRLTGRLVPIPCRCQRMEGHNLACG